MLVTFYSYKGGVGRTLALANVACLMAEDQAHPQRVLLWDLDLDAPGLHELFPGKRALKVGFVDLAYEYASTGELPKLTDYIYESRVDGVDVLPAGQVDESYCEKLQSLDWASFFQSSEDNPTPFFSGLLQQLSQIAPPYDYVLIDSRTGLNDQAGISIQVLSDMVLVLFRLAKQDLKGLGHLVPTIRDELDAMAKEHVPLLPVACQVGTGGPGSHDQNRHVAEDIFDKSLRYIRFDIDLVGQDRLLCEADEIKELWPVPPVVDDYRRLSHLIRSQNQKDTRTQEDALEKAADSADWATASGLVLELLKRRPYLPYAWETLARVYDDRLGNLDKQEFKGLIEGISAEHPNNTYILRWQAALEITDAKDMSNGVLKRADHKLRRALKQAAKDEQGNVYRELGVIASCMGRLDDAARFLRSAHETSPDNSQIIVDLTSLYIRMGSSHFALAAEALMKLSGLGRFRQETLTYLFTYMGQHDAAASAYEQCSSYMKPIAKAHMLIINEQVKDALDLAAEAVGDEGDHANLPNWAEVFLCAEDFDRVCQLAGQSGPDEKKVFFIGELARFLRNEGADEKEMNRTLGRIRKEYHRWDYTELLMFRECSIRRGRDYGNRFDIIEKLIQYDAQVSVAERGAGAFVRVSSSGRAL